MLTLASSSSRRVYSSETAAARFGRAEKIHEAREPSDKRVLWGEEQTSVINSESKKDMYKGPASIYTHIHLHTDITWLAGVYVENECVCMRWGVTYTLPHTGI